MDSYLSLKKIFKKIRDIQNVSLIMSWDESVIMPIGGADVRRESMSTISGIQHEILVSDHTKKLINSVDQDSLAGDWDRVNYNLMKKQYTKRSCLSVELVERFTNKTLACTQAWRELRSKNDWNSFVPYLEDVVDIVKECAQRKSQSLNMLPYDTLLDDYSPGVTQEYLEPIFNGLIEELLILLPKIQNEHKPINKDVDLSADIQSQNNLCRFIMERIGFDFNHGRLDTSHHPFCGGTNGDIRVTTKYYEDDFLLGLMGVCHETGHAMYENNLPKDWLTQPIGQSSGMAVHESQSLLIEMYCCRSKEFIEFLMKNIFKYLGDNTQISSEDIYDYYTQVKPGYIRVHADEVTYPLHVILRYEIEKKLINGDIFVKELPDIWDEYMNKFLGLSKKDNFKDGVMQDIHWTLGAFGYFPSYTLGALFAAQQMNTIQSENNHALSSLKDGDFTGIFAWLKKNIHSFGSFYDTTEIVEKSTRSKLTIEPFLRHIDRRYL
ncbi:MAG: carboxypeptidase M32 [Legionellales bacterium]|nr:carboxypeptidase M32 [Legionellales bacterium]